MIPSLQGSPAALYLRALTHRSWTKENGGQHNEILEFIGDAVLQLCISELLIKELPNKSEGELSQLRHKLVNNQFLAAVSRRLMIGSMVRLGRGEVLSGGRDKTSILADCFEALLGAIYCVRGLSAVQSIVNAQFTQPLHDKTNFIPAKQLLHEWTQRTYHNTPVYQEVERRGPAHNQRFVVKVMVNGKAISCGDGRSKRGATNSAAEKAVKILGLR